jgi:hypothetical protein
MRGPVAPFFEKSGIPRLVDHGGRRRELGKVRHELEEPDFELFAGGLPALFVTACCGVMNRVNTTLGKPLG